MKLVKNLLNKLKTDKFKLGDVYAVTTGTYVGEMFVYIDTISDSHNFLSIPKILNRVVPADKFDYAIETKVIEYVERIPYNERRVCEAQYRANEKC